MSPAPLTSFLPPFSHVFSSHIQFDPFLSPHLVHGQIINFMNYHNLCKKKKKLLSFKYYSNYSCPASNSKTSPLGINFLYFAWLCGREFPAGSFPPRITAELFPWGAAEVWALSLLGGLQGVPVPLIKESSKFK